MTNNFRGEINFYSIVRLYNNHNKQNKSKNTFFLYTVASLILMIRMRNRGLE